MRAQQMISCNDFKIYNCTLPPVIPFESTGLLNAAHEDISVVLYITN